MLAERSGYAERTRELGSLLQFDDEPSDFRRALAERAAVAEEPNGG
jgi:hypothetical protein